MTVETSHTPHCNLVMIAVVCGSSFFSQGYPVSNTTEDKEKILKKEKYYGCHDNLFKIAMTRYFRFFNSLAFKNLHT